MLAIGLLEGASALHPALLSLNGTNGAPNNTAQDAIQRRFLDITAKTVVDGLDSFYADFRNRKIRIAVATAVVLGQIAGLDQARVDAMVVELRKAAASTP
jgi:hypothetical protein